ncbi:MAG: cadherin-like beta sandwich domain-containing protein, partial [Cytophagaceae bacterium]
MRNSITPAPPVSSIAVTPTTSDVNATVSVNGTIVNSGTASGTIPLAVGANTIQTVITAQDGATTQLYTLTVTRASGATITTSVASLPAFSSCYSNASSPQSFTVTGSGLGSDITVLPPAGFQVSQTSGGPYYGAGVTLAQTGGAVSATVYARMAAATSSPSPGNIMLSASGVSTRNVAISGTQNARPTIDLGTVTPVTSASASFSLPYTATTGSPDMYSIFTGSNAMSGFATINSARLTGSPIVIAMPTGTAAGRYDFYLTATNSSTGCISYSNYFAVNVVSTDATLSGLSISSGTLSPAFISGTTNYSASVSNTTTSLTVTPTASDANATITVNGTPVSSGSISGAIALAAGSNTITTVVTAQDGTTTKTYLLTIIRAAASTDANLSNLVVSSGTLA